MPTLRIARINEVPSDDQADLLAEYIEARANADRAQQHLKACADRLTQYMEEHHTKSLTLSMGEQVLHKVTYVQNERSVIDEKGLRKALTAKVFDRYTTKTLNRSALEAAMTTGEVDPMIVSKFVEFKKSSPFLKHTVKENTDG